VLNGRMTVTEELEKCAREWSKYIMKILEQHMPGRTQENLAHIFKLNILLCFYALKIAV
jgi:hypothetical protein